MTLRSETVPGPPDRTPLLAWLLVALRPMNRTRVKQLLGHGRIHVNGVAVTRHDHPVGQGDRISIAARSAGPPLAILHEDDAILAIDKPCGLLAVSTESEKQDTAFARLAAHLKARDAGRPFVVHRLDRDTSGVLLFARTAEIRDSLQSKWEVVEKTYLAIVEGTPREAEGRIENHLIEGKNLRVRIGPPGGEAKLAITEYRTVASRGGHSLIEVNLITGRKHQIRVHLASLGCPVIGDFDYGAKTNPARRLELHAWRLAFPHPVTGTRVAIESPFPAALSRIVRLPV